MYDRLPKFEGGGGAVRDTLIKPYVDGTTSKPVGVKRQTMAYKLPSEADEWISEYQNKLNESEDYTEAGEGWGIGFNGTFLFEIQPDDTYDGESINLFIDVEDGSCNDAYLTEDPDGEDWGFAFRGEYSNWKKLIEGELDPVEGMMDGTFDLDGDMQKVLQYSEAAVVMTESAAEIDTEFEY